MERDHLTKFQKLFLGKRKYKKGMQNSLKINSQILPQETGAAVIETVTVTQPPFCASSCVSRKDA
jgi:hypothetical protein